MPYKHLALCMVLLAAGCNANQALRLPDANLSAKRTDLQVGKHSQSSGYSVLYNFAGAPTDGYEPFGGVFLDGDGSLYGTTFYGGTLPSQPCQIGCGTAFRLTPGAPRDDVLHSFAGPPHDGFGSFGGISAHSGVLYGTSAAGGTKDSGTVFELTRSGRGDWTEKILYAFKGPPSDGSGPSDIAIDPHGVIYGTTFNGGSGTTCFFKTSGCGTVFELMSPAHAGQRWHETVLHNFKGSPDGAGPSGSLVLGSNGAVYGTAAYGGASTECPYLGGCGAVFKLRHARSRWTETIIHSFNVAASSTDGSLPSGSLIAGANGTLIGTTRYGGGLPGCDLEKGVKGCGTVYSLRTSRRGKSGWSESILYVFKGNPNDGAQPGTLLANGSGGFYGVTGGGGSGSCQASTGCGTVFALIPTRHGWSETLLHSFAGAPSDGWSPGGALALSNSVLYGATSAGGSGPCSFGCGSIYEVTNP